MRYKRLLAGFALVVASAAQGQTPSARDFGARESLQSVAISPNGDKVSFLAPMKGEGVALVIANPATKASNPVLRADGFDSKIDFCDWITNQRLICSLSFIKDVGGTLLSFARLYAVNDDGSVLKALGKQSTGTAAGIRQFDGRVVSWRGTDKGEVLISREYVPSADLGSLIRNTDEGLGVDLLDTVSLVGRKVESPRLNIDRYIADDAGVIRLMSTMPSNSIGDLKGTIKFFYRRPGEREWLPFSTYSMIGGAGGAYPVAVDSRENVAYTFDKLNGRDVIYKVKLDGTLARELIVSNDQVDIDNVLTLGSSGRVIGASYATDKRQTVIFDPEYKALAQQIGKALPNLPIVQVIGASRDESKLLMFAGSDTDPGRYYLYDKRSRSLAEIALARPQLETATLAAVKPITYQASDGTAIPGYLTLPPGPKTKALPAIVMPHGGPSARDEWGFDWLAQYFAAQGYAVLQPNYRGSSGYGQQFYVRNGFQSWRTSIGDVNDAGRWMIRQGIADPAKLVIFGWSYGGYAALQANVLDPSLYKAAVAVAPVTDLQRLINESRDFTNAGLVRDFVGVGEHLVSGSPIKHAEKIAVPVLMFSGDIDLNVDIAHAREMDQALRRAGKRSELITYKGLDHYLEDSAVRTDMLTRSSDFFAAALGGK